MEKSEIEMWLDNPVTAWFLKTLEERWPRNWQEGGWERVIYLRAQQRVFDDIKIVTSWGKKG